MDIYDQRNRINMMSVLMMLHIHGHLIILLLFSLINVYMYEDAYIYIDMQVYSIGVWLISLQF